MISDRDTNTIYFSDRLNFDSRFKDTFALILSTLDTFSVIPKFLPNTNDVWSRDYMPIQVTDSKFVEYRFDPDYLQGHWKGCRDSKSYPDIVCDSLKLKTIKSDLVMDGGNIVKLSDCVILTDKIVQENRFSYSKNALISKLQNTFQVNKVILIPWYKKERFGHADGVLRFIDNETVLISHHYISDRVLLYRLKQGGLKSEFLNFKVKKQDKRNWAYINFLQTKDLILLPKFSIDEDDQAFEQISYFYPDYAKNNRIAQVCMTDIVRFGGALNCITWTIKT